MGAAIIYLLLLAGVTGLAMGLFFAFRSQKLI